MNKSIVITALSLLIAFSGFAQSKDVKGPKYKNTKPSERNEGSSSILVKEDPTQFQGPQYKNLDQSNYEIEVLDSQKPQAMPNVDLVASTENKIYETAEGEEVKEKIIYRRVETKDMKSKNTKGLKGPAYKNYKP